MISLAEKPKKIKIDNPRGPYNLDGLNKENPTDDKPYIHKYRGKFYLSWGCFYAAVYHNCGEIMSLVESYKSLGAKVVEPFSPIPLGDANLQKAKELVNGEYVSGELTR